MRFTILLPLLTAAATTTLALPIAQPFDIALLGMCLTGHQHCHDGPGLFSSMFASGPGAAAGHKRAEAGTELGVGGLFSSLPLLSSLFGGGGQKGSSKGGSGGGLGGLGLKERRGEEAGITDLFSSLPFVSSLFGGGQAKGGPSGTVMGASGRTQHPGGTIGI